MPRKRSTKINYRKGYQRQPKYVSTEGVTDSESAAAEAIEQPQKKMQLAGTEDNEKMRPAESESKATGDPR